MGMKCPINGILVDEHSVRDTVALHSGEPAQSRITAMSKKVIPRWNAAAANLVKAHLKLRGIGYSKLSDKLKAIDVIESERGIANKLSRGGFPFTFYLQCMRALGHSSVTINLAELGVDTETKVLIAQPGAQSPAKTEAPPK